ncbi:hypothetical protein [Coleofasciculus sp. E1-EBD-02]|uniref:hypothetical protein n=1 Tax=Coleofasciculus sp. E1-EBD-02 TaxID=3068481 RepID=UPI0032FA846D
MQRLAPTFPTAAGIKILEQLRRYDEAGGAEGAGEAGGDISCSVISAFLHYIQGMHLTDAASPCDR